MSTIQISVTQPDIDAAKVESSDAGYHPSCDCATARAIRRCIPDARVLLDGLSLHNPIPYVAINGNHVALPLSARQFIRRFDAGEAVEPLVFELEVGGD